MIPGQQTSRLPIPTLDELAEASAEEREIVACSALKHGSLIALRLGLRNKGTATVTLNDVGGFYLLEALKVLFPNAGSRPASPVKVTETPTGMEIQVGHMS